MLLKPSETAIARMSLLYYCILLFFGCCIRGLNLGTLHSNMWQHSGYVNRHVFLPLCICATPEEDPLSFYSWPWSEGCVAAACFSQWLNVFFFLLDTLGSCHWKILLKNMKLNDKRLQKTKQFIQPRSWKKNVFVSFAVFTEWESSHWAAIRRCNLGDTSRIVFSDSNIQLITLGKLFQPSSGNNQHKTRLALVNKQRKCVVSYLLEWKDGGQTRRVSSLPTRRPQIRAKQPGDHLRIKHVWPT